MADNSHDEWIPLRQSVVEVARAYSEFMLCEPSAALDTAQMAVLRSLETGACQARAPKWIMTFHATDKYPESRQDQLNGLEIPMAFWAIYRNAETVITDDWIAGDYSFSWDGNFADDSDRLAVPENGICAFGLAIGIEVTRGGLPLIGDGETHKATQSPDSVSFRQMVEERRGRPRRWDWEGALCHVVAEANRPDGLPDGYGAQAGVGRLLADWFVENQSGQPAPSEIGNRAARIIRAIEAHRK